MPKTKSSRKPMTKTELFDHLTEKTSLKRAQVKELFAELANLASNQLKTRNEFVLPGFGKLVRSQRRAREGRNPATGETISIPAKTVVKFRVGKALKVSALGGDSTVGSDR